MSCSVCNESGEMLKMKDLIDFYRKKRVLVTGCTGFKGSWLCTILKLFGADVTGFALEAPTNPNLFELACISEKIKYINGDVRNLAALKKTFEDSSPEIVFHLAAQPIVRESYRSPVYTYETNVIGTVNILECVRLTNSVKSFVNVTTDKVYKNNEWNWGYRENEPLDGYDPYSNSKSCSELVTATYKRSFFSERSIAVSTARAGNVIGGGDFADDRIIPDCVRAALKNEDIIIRNPYATRPYQHVLEPLFAYLMIAQRQYEDIGIAGCYNVGPDDNSCVNNAVLADLFCKYWGGITWKNVSESKAVHEANFLKLDCSLIKSVFGWTPVWDIDETVKRTVEWTKAWVEGRSIEQVMENQIKSYINLKG